MKKSKYDFGGWATKNDLLCADGRTIRRDAFKDDDGRTVPLVYQHNHDDPTRIIGHALLENRNEGVYAYCSLNNTDIGRHVKECVRHGDVNGLSIFANKLTQRGGDVLHGVIRELSIVLAGANPGAVIEFPILEHGEESETEAYIWTGEEGIDLGDGMKLSHSDDDASEATQETAEDTPAESEAALAHADKEDKPKASLNKEDKAEEEDEDEEDGDETVQDVLDSMNEKQRNAVNFVIDQVLQGKSLKHSDDEEDDGDEPAADQNGANKGEETVADVLKTLNKKQRKVFLFLLEKAEESAQEGADEEPEKEEADAASHSDDEGEEFTMEKNIFDKDLMNEQQENTLTHAQMETLIKDGRKMGSLRESVLAHSAEYGIEQIDYLMPEYKEASGAAAPQFIKRDQGWVTKVINGVHHTPFSKIKTTFADITADEARARGYIKGKLKKEEVFGLLKRTTSATTIYKKQKMDRDDKIEITSFDVVAWLKTEMRMMLDEEIARAILVGDGRNVDSDDKINEDNIRPILKDSDLFVIRKTLKPAEGQDPADALIDTVTYAWEGYQGSGNCVAFMTRKQLSALKLLKDKMGRRMYATENEIASVLGVTSIVTVPCMGDATSVRVDGGKTYAPAVIILNLDDYNVGADKGGAINMFEDFDIDYNQEKYLIETRCSGALVKPYSAIVIEEEVNPQ